MKQTKSSQHTTSDLGQTLLELVVTIGITVIVVSGMVIIILNSLKNSQFAKNQSQATKLAQEFLEEVRAIKDRNCQVRLANGLTYVWYSNTQPLIWDISSSFPTNNNRHFVTNLSNIQCTLNESNTPKNIDQFKIYGTISDDSETNPVLIQRYKITAWVTWGDISGMHESKLVTVLAK